MSLILDNCHAADELAVREIEAPEATATWHPLSHAQVIDSLEAEFDKRNINIVKRSFALAKGKFNGIEVPGARLFAEFIAEEEGNSYARAYGLRNSIDQSMPVNLCGGENVMVCGNMCFNGDFMVSHKHTSQIETVMPSLLGEAIDSYTSAFGERQKQIEHWNTIEVDQQLADHVIMSARRARALVAANIEPINDEFWNPRHTDFKEPTLWNLHNAYTEIQKTRKADPNVVADETIKFSRVLGSMFPVPN